MARTRESTPTAEVVVVVHGLLRSHRSFFALRPRLEEAGYRVADFDYQSVTRSIEEHGEALRRRVEDLAADQSVIAIHFVTHSMGGLVVRAALGPQAPDKVRRVVMLAPPNQGSPLARKLQPMLGNWLRPLAELSDHEESTARSLPVPAGVEIGVIAASLDHAVPEASTHLPGEADHLELPGTHSFLMWQGPVALQVVAFLRSGRFEHH